MMAQNICMSDSDLGRGKGRNLASKSIVSSGDAVADQGERALSFTDTE
jgi:hypothetical protein